MLIDILAFVYAIYFPDTWISSESANLDLADTSRVGGILDHVQWLIFHN